MTDGVITIDESATIDKRIDTEQLTVNALTVQRERMQIAGTVDVEITDVANVPPGASDYGLIVRPLGQTDNTAIVGTTAMGALFDDTPPTITDGFVGIPRMNDLRYLITDLTQIAGAAITAGSTTITSGTPCITIATNDGVRVALNGLDTANATFDTTMYVAGTNRGLQVGAVRSDTLASKVGSNNDIAPLQVDVLGALYVRLPANDGIDIGDVDVTSVIPLTGATNLGKAIQSAQGTTDTGVAALVVRNDVLADLAGVDGDYTPLQVNATGA